MTVMDTLRQIEQHEAKKKEKKKEKMRTSDQFNCETTWSATARANLSILDPASAIFLAALITSEEFFRGPLPLLKFKE